MRMLSVVDGTSLYIHITCPFGQGGCRKNAQLTVVGLQTGISRGSRVTQWPEVGRGHRRNTAYTRGGPGTLPLRSARVFEQIERRVLYHRYIYRSRNPCYSGSRNWAMPGKDKEMILRNFSVMISKYQDLSLCGSEYEQHGLLACPYKTEKNAVKQQP